MENNKKKIHNLTHLTANIIGVYYNMKPEKKTFKVTVENTIIKNIRYLQQVFFF